MNPLTSASSPPKPPDTVTFSYFAPAATYVSLAGNFNNWNPRSLPMHKGPDGVWRISLSLESGACDYQFYVDGVWHDDPAQFARTKCG